MKQSKANGSIHRKYLASALISIGVSYGLSGCGGGSSAPAAVAPPTPPTVSIDVFGARGALLTAVVSSTDCATTPTVSWQNSSGVAVGSGTSIQDTQPNSILTATASCSTATASQKLAANSVHTALSAFAVLQNGSAVAWGNPVWGGQTSTAAAITSISQLYASERGFAALLSDNTMKAWGSSYVAVTDPNLVYPATGAIATSPLTNIATVMPGRLAYFVTKKDGSIAAWGKFRGVTDGVDGYIGDAKTGLNPVTLALLTDVKAQASTEGAYALLKGDGTVVTFGDQDAGGNSSAVQPLLVGVTQIVGNNFDFVALRKDGKVVTWGYGYAAKSGDAEINPTLADISKLYVSGNAAAAVSNTGAAFAFGFTPQIEAADSSSLTASLTNVSNIYSTQTAFAALRTDGTVISWGDLPRMGNSLNAVQSSLTNVKSVQATEYAFAALKGDGTVISWGDPELGGDSSAVKAQLTNVVALSANKYAFAALKSDGSVVTWGMKTKGGDSSAVAAKLTNVRAIYATAYGAFLAVNKDGSFVTWGDQWAGGGTAPATLTKIPYLG